MEYEIVRLEEKRVVGFCARTGSDKEDISNVIGGLWKKLGKITAVQGRKKETSIGLYTDYVGMEYNTMVGYEVEKDAVIPKDMTEKIIPAGKYAKFVLHGNVVKTVQKAWQEIWEMNLERTFIADFEEYQQGNDMDNMEIHIYVAIK